MPVPSSIRFVTDAARQAERVAASMKKPLSPHRLPALFLGVALAIYFAGEPRR